MSLDQTIWSYYLYRFAGAAVPKLPRRFGYWFFERLGDLVFLLSRPSREAVEDNVEHVLGTASSAKHRQQVVRSIFRHQAKNYCDLFRLSSLSESRIKQLVTIHGLPHLESGLSSGHGVVIVTLHLGNVDLVGQGLSVRGYPVTAVAEHLKPEPLYRYICSLRASKGIQLVPSDSVLRSVFRALDWGQVVGLAADRDTTQSGVVTDFFGAPARLPDGYLQLALRTGAALVPAFGLRRPDNSFSAHIEPAIHLESTGNLRDDVRSSFGRVMPILEHYIATYLEQWVMFQPVWQV